MVDLKAFLAKKEAESTKAKIYLERMKYFLTLSTEQIVKQLKKDNGEVTGPYFLNESCTTRNTKIKVGHESEEVHHVKEENHDNPRVCALSDPTTAAYYPFEWQQPENLVYVDKLEHLLLHIKGNIYRMYALDQLVDDAVDAYMIPALTKFYNNGEIQNNQKAAFERIKLYKDTFLLLINYYYDAREKFILEHK